MIRIGLPGRVMGGAGLAPALAFPSIRQQSPFVVELLGGGLVLVLLAGATMPPGQAPVSGFCL